MTLCNCNSLNMCCTVVLQNHICFSGPFHKCSFIYLSRWFERERSMREEQTNHNLLSAHIWPHCLSSPGQLGLFQAALPETPGSLHLSNWVRFYCLCVTALLVLILMFFCWGVDHLHTHRLLHMLNQRFPWCIQILYEAQLGQDSQLE